MKITTNKQPASHDRLMFWGQEAADKRDLSKAVGRYDEKSDELYLAGEDDLTRKIKKLVDIGVNFNAHKHKNSNYFIADTFSTPTTSDLNESELNELTEPEFKSKALSFSDFVKSQTQPENSVKTKTIKPDKNKSLSETEFELIHAIRNQSSQDLINATLKELEESYDPHL